MADSQQIDIPGVGIVEFPSSMSDAEVSAAAKHLHDQANYRPDSTMQAETARAIGRSQGLGFGASRPPVVDELGRPQTSTEPDTWWGGFGKSLKDQALDATVNNPALQAAARPQSASDLTALMLPNFSGNGFGSVANAIRDTRQSLAKPADLVLNTLVKKTGIDPDALSLQATRLRLEAARRATRNVRTAAELATPPAAPTSPGVLRTTAAAPLSDQELLAQKLAELQARGRQISTSTPAPLTPEQAAAQATVHSGAVLETPVPAVNGPQGVPVAAIGPEASTRAATMNGAAPHPLEQPRLAVGAEAAGRAAGLSKQAVRDASGPMLGEAHGAASPVPPEDTLAKFFTKMRGMDPQGTERFDYVNAARDPKTRAVLENLRRTLKLAGLSAAGAVGSRQALVNMMQQDQ